MKGVFSLLVVASSLVFFSCNENAGSNKKGSDSATTGLEGTREDQSQLSNATIDTSGGQSGKKTAKDSLHVKDSLPVK